MTLHCTLTRRLACLSVNNYCYCNFLQEKRGIQIILVKKKFWQQNCLSANKIKFFINLKIVCKLIYFWCVGCFWRHDWAKLTWRLIILIEYWVLVIISHICTHISNFYYTLRANTTEKCRLKVKMKKKRLSNDHQLCAKISKTIWLKDVRKDKGIKSIKHL